MMLRTNCRSYGAKSGLLGNLPIGAIVRDTGTVCYGEPILWQVADAEHPGYPEGSVTLISYRLPSLRCYDAKEPLNTDILIRTTGNAQYSLSNVRQWANSEAAAGEWYSPAHQYDGAPVSSGIYSGYSPYADEPGFLHGFSSKFIAAIMPTSYDVLSAFSPYELYQITDKIFLPSAAEVGLNMKTFLQIEDGSALKLFSDSSNLSAYPSAGCVQNTNYIYESLNTASPWSWRLRTPYSGKQTYSAYVVSSAGTLETYYVNYGHLGFRPLCNLPSVTKISAVADTDGIYDLFV